MPLDMVCVMKYKIQIVNMTLGENEWICNFFANMFSCHAVLHSTSCQKSISFSYMMDRPHFVREKIVWKKNEGIFFIFSFLLLLMIFHKHKLDIFSMRNGMKCFKPAETQTCLFGCEVEAKRKNWCIYIILQ